MDQNEMIKKYMTEKPDHPYPENMILGRACAADGMVLLKNHNNVLPLQDKAIALFGSGATDTVTCGTGSGYAPAPYTVNVLEGLLNAGLTVTSNSWLTRFVAATKKANDEDKTLTPVKRLWSGLRILIDDLPITEDDLTEAKAANTAIYVLRRNAGEDKDRSAVKGDYYLTDIEADNLRLLGEHFDKTVVVLNTCVIDANFIDEIPGLNGLLLMGLAGNESGNALADILLGEVTPSGKLTDTWAKKYSDYPASATFGLNDGDAMQEDYNEGVYVGYRYFDSFRIEPLYPFGYGLSYTSFSHEVVDYEVSTKTLNITLDVGNIGDFPGKEVIQVYVSGPKGNIDKPFQELVAFVKSGLIQPRGHQVLTVNIPMENLSSYDESIAAFVMEAGKYKIRIGSDSRNTSVAFMIELEGKASLRQVNNQMPVDHPLNLIEAPNREEILEAVPVVKLCAADFETIDGRNTIERVTKTYIAKGQDKVRPSDKKKINLPFETEEIFEVIEADYESTLIDVAEGRTSMEAFVASLDPEVLCRIVAGDANETPFEVKKRLTQAVTVNQGINSSGNTTGLYVESLGIPNCRMTDGPAGLHVIGGATTSFPVGMVLAQTWDEKYCEAIGSAMGREMTHYNFSVILGPGMNIHRDPLCGRNFEYFAEDPLITGKIASAITKGIQANDGIFVSIKHFACNNQESNRTETNSTVSERALREIYLKAFEICVREASPATVMTSYNKINGTYASSHYELLTEVLRGEWGFDGLVMTDWGTSSTKAFDLHAGNDLIMGGFRSQYLMAALNGTAPIFIEDGGIKTDVYEVYGGFMKETLENWNAFLPDAKGQDSVAARVADGLEVNASVKGYVDRGIATVTEDEEGILVTYRGIDRGSFLKLGDLQKCAMNVLSGLIKSSAYRTMLNHDVEK